MASNATEVLDPAAKVEKLKEIAASRALDRRHFIAALGLTGAAAGAGLLSGCSVTNSTVAATNTLGQAQTNILNFALNLEFLEATFYSFVTTGADINPSATGVSLAGSGAVTGAPAQVTFTVSNAQQISDLLDEIYFDEFNHVKALQTLLGPAAVPRPALNLAALGAVTATNALAIARLLEDIGVTAYIGGATGTTAAPGLTNSSLTFAGQILAVESFHSGALRLLSIQNAITPILAGDTFDVQPDDLGTPAAEAAGPTASGGFFATSGAPTGVPFAPTYTNVGVAYGRTPSQVLALLYGSLSGASVAPAAKGTSSGGFFPKGVNVNGGSTLNTV
jgi:hypothetical protein